jgi:hypothetical protein
METNKPPHPSDGIIAREEYERQLRLNRRLGFRSSNPLRILERELSNQSLHPIHQHAILKYCERLGDSQDFIDWGGAAYKHFIAALLNQDKSIDYADIVASIRDLIDYCDAHSPNFRAIRVILIQLAREILVSEFADELPCEVVEYWRVHNELDWDDISYRLNFIRAREVTNNLEGEDDSPARTVLSDRSYQPDRLQNPSTLTDFLARLKDLNESELNYSALSKWSDETYALASAWFVTKNWEILRMLNETMQKRVTRAAFPVDFQDQSKNDEGK